MEQFGKAKLPTVTSVDLLVEMYPEPGLNWSLFIGSSLHCFDRFQQFIIDHTLSISENADHCLSSKTIEPWNRDWSLIWIFPCLSTLSALEILRLFVARLDLMGKGLSFFLGVEKLTGSLLVFLLSLGESMWNQFTQHVDHSHWYEAYGDGLQDYDYLLFNLLLRSCVIFIGESL